MVIKRIIERTLKYNLKSEYYQALVQRWFETLDQLIADTTPKVPGNVWPL